MSLLSIMSPQDEQWSTTVCSQNINKQNVKIADETLSAFSVGITILNQRIIYKDDIEFVTEFPCLLGHPVQQKYPKRGLRIKS